jgi:superfamily II RNA helicase
LARWSEDHSSAAWKVAEKAWLRKKSLEDQAAMLESQLADVSTGEERLEPVLAALKEWGFLEGVTLTHKGVLATEVNEGNPILMVELYTSGILKDAAPSEIVATLAAQCGDVPRSADQGKYPHLVAADFLASTAKRGSAIDSRYGVEYSPDSWTLSPYWPSILYEWMEGADAAHLTESNDLYAANLMRGILKAANLLNEWIAMATFCGDLAMLDKLKDVPVHLLRGIAQPESLYLHL